MHPFPGFDLGCCHGTVLRQPSHRSTLGSAVAALEAEAASPHLTADFLERVRRRFWHLPRWKWFSAEDAALLERRGRGLLDHLRRDVRSGMGRILAVRGDLLTASVVARFAHPRRCAILSAPVAEFFDPVYDLEDYLRFLDHAEEIREAAGALPSAAAVGEALYQLNRDLLGLLERDGLRPCAGCTNAALVRDGVRDLLARHGGSPRPGAELVPPELKPRFAREFREFVLGTAALRADATTRYVGVSFGRVRAWWKVVRAARASRDTGILLLGPPGSGKEPLARAAHDASEERRRGRFHAVSGANLRGPLAESELFGHRRGAYTGAMADREGAFLRAQGGTLFLDEVGELTPEVQAALLRTLQERSVRPLGSDHDPKPVDVRVVAATNRPLALDIARERFRRDLYDRLAGEVVEVPGLRRDDVNLPPLVHTVLRRMAEERGRPFSIDGEALRILCDREWPGNVRELMTALERAAHRARDGLLDAASVLDALEASLPVPAPAPPGLPLPAEVRDSCGDPVPFGGAGPAPAPRPSLPGTLLPPPEAVRAWFAANGAARGDTLRLSALLDEVKRAMILPLAREGRHRRSLGEIARIVGASQASLTKFLGKEALERRDGRVYLREEEGNPANASFQDEGGG